MNMRYNSTESAKPFSEALSGVGAGNHYYGDVSAVNENFRLDYKDAVQMYSSLYISFGLNKAVNSFDNTIKRYINRMMSK